MLVKLYDERSAAWVIIDNVFRVERFDGRWAYDCKPELIENPQVKIKKLTSRNPLPKGWETSAIYVNWLFALPKKNQGFKVIRIIIAKREHEKTIAISFHEGFLMNESGQTIERL